MPPAPKPTRRGLQFGLGSLLGVISVVAIVSAFVAPELLRQIEQRRLDRELNAAFLQLLKAPPGPIPSFHDDVFPAASRRP